MGVCHKIQNKLNFIVILSVYVAVFENNTFWTGDKIRHEDNNRYWY